MNIRWVVCVCVCMRARVERWGVGGNVAISNKDTKLFVDSTQGKDEIYIVRNTNGVKFVN
jgi:hypothetical protein